jgi:hypothetical protein
VTETGTERCSPFGTGGALIFPNRTELKRVTAHINWEDDPEWPSKTFREVLLDYSFRGPLSSLGHPRHVFLLMQDKVGHCLQGAL